MRACFMNMFHGTSRRPSARVLRGGRWLSFRPASPDEDMQAPGDDWSSSPLLVERVQPGAALHLGNHARSDGHLGAAVSHAGVEAAPLGLEGKEAASSDV